MQEQPTQDSVKAFMAHVRAFKNISSPNSIPSTSFDFQDYLKWMEIKCLEEVKAVLQDICAELNTMNENS